VKPKNAPFNFIFDHLLPLDITVKPLFGMFYIYAGPRIILVLRDRKEQPDMNGIWVATSKGQQESLKKELPVLRAFSGPTSRDTGNGWQIIPKDAADFESAAIRVCELIVHRDPRIGKIPVPPKKRQKNNPGGPGLSKN
jgi:hypothetical protein